MDFAFIEISISINGTLANFRNHEFFAEFFTPKPARGGQANLGAAHKLKMSLHTSTRCLCEERSDEAISSILFLKFSENQNLPKFFLLK